MEVGEEIQRGRVAKVVTKLMVGEDAAQMRGRAYHLKMQASARLCEMQFLVMPNCFFFFMKQEGESPYRNLLKTKAVYSLQPKIKKQRTK